MRQRNLSPQAMFAAMAADHTPTHQFTEEVDFAAWKAETKPLVMATLGDFPPRVDPNPELAAEWEDDGLRKQLWWIDVGPHIAAKCQVNLPADVGADERRPAILCCHGHGPYGKEPMMGNLGNAAVRESAAAHNYTYGHAMAKAGYVTFAIDWIGFGQRNDNRKPNHRSQNGARDWCNLYYLHATMLGSTSLAVNVRHGQVATDFACALPNVDPDRLGVMGLSGGGTMTTWMAFCDERFKAAEIICYTDLWANFGVRDCNYCGMQVAPGLYKLVDLPDLQGLLAPLPLCLDIGAQDDCFLVDTALASYRQIERVYAAAGVPDRLELDLHPGGHGWGANRSEAFFGQWL